MQEAEDSQNMRSSDLSFKDGGEELEPRNADGP